MSKANQFTKCEAGNLSSGGVLAMVVTILVVAAAIPIAVTAINDSNTTGWSAGQVALWGILGLVIIALVVIAFTRGLTKGGGA